jgi:hypothetical protein
MTDVRTIEKPAARRKTCARCGIAFGCNPGGCWCATEPYRLPMPEPGAAEDCICPTCLRAEAVRRGAL